LDGVLLRCLDHLKSKEILQELHKGFCGGNCSLVVISHIIIQVALYWPTMFKVAYSMIFNFNHVKKIQEI
jgi:hypothetical protein